MSATLSWGKTTLELLRQMSEQSRRASQRFVEESLPLRQRIQSQRHAAQIELMHLLLQTSLPHIPKNLEPVIEEVTSYAQRCDWAFYDVEYLAACLASPSEDLPKHLAQVGLIYQSLRMIDDILDSHDDYKGSYETALGFFRRRRYHEQEAVAFILLPALLMLIAGLHKGPARWTALAQRTIGGALHEFAARENVSLEEYRQIVEGKMVSYGLMQFSPVIEEIPEAERAAIEDFLKASFFAGQMINDLHDLEQDRTINQPNIWVVKEDQTEREKILIETMCGLLALSTGLSAPFQPYAHNRIHSLVHYFEEAIVG